MHGLIPFITLGSNRIVFPPLFWIRIRINANSNGLADPAQDWESGSKQAEIVPEKGKNKEFSCITSSLLDRRRLLESECPF
jgi:hypothetical protein